MGLAPHSKQTLHEVGAYLLKPEAKEKKQRVVRNDKQWVFSYQFELYWWVRSYWKGLDKGKEENYMTLAWGLDGYSGEMVEKAAIATFILEFY